MSDKNNTVRLISPGAIWKEVMMPDRLFNRKQPEYYSGWQSLDTKFICHKGEHCVVYGRAGQGKTTWIYNILMNQALKHNSRCIIFAPEEFSTKHILRRLAFILNGKSYLTLTDDEDRYTMNFINQYFRIIEAPRLGTFWDHVKFAMSEARNDGFKFDSFLIDHAMMLEKKETMHEDNIRYLMNEFIDYCEETDSFGWIVNHVQKPVMRFDQSTKQTFCPPMDMTEMAHGQMWARLAFNVFEIHRPNPDIEGSEIGEVWLNIRKVKNPDSGSIGRVKLFYNRDTNQYFENQQIGNNEF